MSVSSSSSKESSSSSLESARARTASRLSTGAAHGRSATRDTARAGAHFRPTCWRPTLCLAATVALGARREVAIAPTSRGFGDARVTHEGRCDSGANPRTSAGCASRSARRLRPAASLLRSLGNKGRLTDPFFPRHLLMVQRTLDLLPLRASREIYFFESWVHFDSEPRPNGQDRSEIWVSCGAVPPGR